MSKVNRMLKHARADLLEVGNVEFEKKAHPIWELEAAGDKIVATSKAAADKEDKEESEPEEGEVEVKMEVEQQPAMLPFEQGQLVMFVLGGRSFTGSVLASDETSSVVQTGVRKYKVENDFLYKVSQQQPPGPHGNVPMMAPDLLSKNRKISPAPMAVPPAAPGTLPLADPAMPTPPRDLTQPLAPAPKPLAEDPDYKQMQKNPVKI